MILVLMQPSPSSKRRSEVSEGLPAHVGLALAGWSERWVPDPNNRTLANISHWAPTQVDALRALLKGATSVGTPLPQAFDVVRSRPHSHVA